MDGEILSAIKSRVSYGIESTYSGSPGVERVRQAIEAGYRIEGIYLGTASPKINVERIDQRVLLGTGHRVDPARIPERYRYSLSNLRRTVQQFDELMVMDNSKHDPLGIPEPVEQCFLERGEVVRKTPESDILPWCKAWLESVEQSLSSKRRLEEKRISGLDLAP